MTEEEIRAFFCKGSEEFQNEIRLRRQEFCDGKATLVAIPPTSVEGSVHRELTFAALTEDFVQHHLTVAALSRFCCSAEPVQHPLVRQRIYGMLNLFFCYNSFALMSSPLIKNEVGGYKDRFWYPRFWDGMTLRAWQKLLKSGKYRVAPIRWAMALLITLLALTVNSPWTFLQRLFYGRKIQNTPLVGDPIFIIGHWRSGTTLLHEYIIRDPRFSFADTFACFAPEHFVLTRFFLRPLAAMLMPKKRPIDNMEAGFDRPQEDEFALTAMGLPSPYRNLIFPNNKPSIDTDYLTLRNVSAQQRSEWLDGLEHFLKSLTYLAPDKQIVLKSPPHTGRIRTILERFPNAKFIHIHRNPYSIFPSTYNLWMRLARDEGAQRPNGDGMEDYVFDSLNTMYEALEEDAKDLPSNRFYDVGYKELTANPVETLEKIYLQLELGGFEKIRPVFEEYAASQKSYKKNKFEMLPELKEQIAVRWHRYFERYGYEK